MNKCLERVCAFGGGCEVFYGNDLEDFECADVPSTLTLDTESLAAGILICPFYTNLHSISLSVSLSRADVSKISHRSIPGLDFGCLHDMLCKPLFR